MKGISTCPCCKTELVVSIIEDETVLSCFNSDSETNITASEILEELNIVLG